MFMDVCTHFSIVNEAWFGVLECVCHMMRCRTGMEIYSSVPRCSIIPVPLLITQQTVSFSNSGLKHRALLEYQV